MQTFYRLPAVVKLTGRSKVTIYSDIKKKRFPPPFKLGPRASAWLESDLERWLADRIAASQQGGAE